MVLVLRHYFPRPFVA